VIFLQTAPLESLTLCNCHLTDADITQICLSLKDNKTISRLDVSINGFTDEGGTAILKLLKSNPNIKDIIILGNELSSEMEHRLSVEIARAQQCIISNLPNLKDHQLLGSFRPPRENKADRAGSIGSVLEASYIKPDSPTSASRAIAKSTSDMGVDNKSVDLVKRKYESIDQLMKKESVIKQRVLVLQQQEEEIRKTVLNLTQDQSNLKRSIKLLEDREKELKSGNAKLEKLEKEKNTYE